MSNRRSAVLLVTQERARGIADGTVTTILSKRAFRKIGMPVFIMAGEPPVTDLYIRLGTGRTVTGGNMWGVDGTGLSAKELDSLFRRGPVQCYPIEGAVRLDHPVPLSRFEVPRPRPFSYSEVTLEEVLS